MRKKRRSLTSILSSPSSSIATPSPSKPLRHNSDLIPIDRAATEQRKNGDKRQPTQIESPHSKKWVNTEPRAVASSAMTLFQTNPISVVAPEHVTSGVGQQNSPSLQNQSLISFVLASAKIKASKSCKSQPHRIQEAPHGSSPHGCSIPALEAPQVLIEVVSPEPFPRLQGNPNELQNDPESSHPEVPLNKLSKRSRADKIIGSKASSLAALSFYPPSIIEGNVSIEIDEEEFEEEINQCKECLVGFFLGKRMPLHLVKRDIDAQWPLKDSYEIKTIGDSCFYFTFSHPEDRVMVLEKGMTHVANRLFIIKEWSITVEVEADSLTTIPIWVMLRGLPKIMQNKKGHSKLASGIGIPMYPDQLTEEGSRTSSARILVEIPTE